MASLLMLIYQVFSKDLPFYKWKETSILRLVLSGIRQFKHEYLKGLSHL